MFEVFLKEEKVYEKTNEDADGHFSVCIRGSNSSYRHG